MKVIVVNLPQGIKSIELHIFADEHIGDENCDIARLKERIKYVAEKPNAYCAFNGDIIDNATRTSIGDCYASQFQPMEQVKYAIELFQPIKDKVIFFTNGNHENRTWRKEGIDLSYLLAAGLGVLDKYSPTSALVFLRFGAESRGRKDGKGNVRKITYIFYALHGSGGGRKEGAKAIRLADMASIVDADIYCHAHTHLPMIMKQAYHRVDSANSTVSIVDKLFVNTASNLNYGGYGEAQEFKPSSKESPVIYMNGIKKEFTAML